MTSEVQRCAEELIDFIDAAGSPYHVVEKCNELLGPVPLFEKKGMHEGQIYCFPLYHTGAVFVAIGKNVRKAPLRIACAHTDFPCLRIKPNPVIREHGYGKLNVEVSCSSWMFAVRS